MTERIEISTASQDAAKLIYQDVLDVLSAAVVNYDPEVLASRIGFPLKMETQGEEFVIETLEEWLRSARAFHNSLKSLGVNHYIRLATSADFMSENYIEGRHVTHTLRNTTPVVPSYANRAVLSRVDGIWKITEIHSAMENDRWPISMPQIDVTRIPDLGERDAASDIRRTSSSPLELYRAYLDASTKTIMENDFAAWCELSEFPHMVHIDHVDEYIEKPEEIRPFFDMLQGQINEHQVDQFERLPERAEFLSASQICGYHTTRLFSKGDLKLGPVAGRFILNRTGTTWRMTSITNSIANAEFPYSLPQLSDALVSLRDIQERTKRQ